MASIISAGTTSGTALNFTGDTSGNLAFQTGGGTNTITVPNTTGTILTTGSPQSGGVIQVVQGYITAAFTTNSNSAWVDITNLTVSITPKFSTSKILVNCVLTDCATDGSAGDGMFQVLRGSTAIGNGNNGGTNPMMGYVATYPSGIYTDSVNFSYLDSPSTTSSTTYKVQCRLWNNGGGTDGNLYIGRRALNASFLSPSSITVMEIAA